MKRIGVTTARDRSDRIADFVRDGGAQPVVLPCIEVRPADEIATAEFRRRCAAADLVIITSERTVAALWPDGGMPQVPCAVVGQATATAVRTAGGVVDVIGDAGAAALVELLGWRLRGLRVALPQSSAASAATAAAMTDLGGVPDVMAAYTVTPVAPPLDPVDAVMFASPSAVTGFLLGGRALDGLAVAVIGETTGAALREHGVQPDVIAGGHSYESMVAGLLARLESGAGTQSHEDERIPT